MPSIDHSTTKSTNMAAISNSLEVFDMYKQHQEEKDSDEESFHLPLDDDEASPKMQDEVRNESEDDILNKFDIPSGNPEAIDSTLEEHLLKDEDEESTSTKAVQGKQDSNIQTDESDPPTKNEDPVDTNAVSSEQETTLPNGIGQNEEDVSMTETTECASNGQIDEVKITKDQNDDSEDLFDISIIRDADEDNAERAYNEAHPDDGDDKSTEEEGSSDKNENAEDDEEMDVDKQDDQEVEIEETTLECGADVECDNSICKESLSDIDKVQDTTCSDSYSETNTRCADSFDSDKQEFLEKTEQKTEDITNTEDNLSEHRKPLKRSAEDEATSSTPKKLKTLAAESIGRAKAKAPIEKPPLRSLSSLSDYIKNKKTKKLSMADLEEFCLQKICEVLVYRSDMGELHHQLQMQEQVIDTMRKEILQLTKQTRDLETVNGKLIKDLKQHNTSQKPLNPLKITRSVGLQVKFTPSAENNGKRRPPAGAIQNNQKAQAQNNARSKNPPNAAAALPKTKQVATPKAVPTQKPLPAKPIAPLLSHALQIQKPASPITPNKVTTPQVARQKPDEVVKPPGTTSASVIDLTDEDDRKEIKGSPAKFLKNIALPLRTTPVRLQTPHTIKLAAQGKVPISTAVSPNTTQLMYVVSSSANALTSTLGPKTVVVNFQSTNGILSSTLNGAPVSMLTKQANTIQLKALAPAKPIQVNTKLVKPPVYKHPARLPCPPPIPHYNQNKALKGIPPKPHLTIRKTDTGIILQWKMPYELEMYEVIASYQLYAYQETSAQPSTDMWRKVGDVKALALPMACTLTQFADKNKYYFAVRAVDIHKRIGVFSDPEEISL